MSTLQLLQQKETDHNLNRSSGLSDLSCQKANVPGDSPCVGELQRILLPLSDVLHLVHGPSACAACSWNQSNESLTSSSQPNRLGFVTDLQDSEMERGGKKKLYRSLTQLMYAYAPKAAFVYPSCLLAAGYKDIVSVCDRVEKENGVPVFPLVSDPELDTEQSSSVIACKALFALVDQGDEKGGSQYSINVLGELNSGGDAWTLKRYYEQIGVQVVAMLTGDGKLANIHRARGAALNVVHRSDIFLPLAEMMQEKLGIPYIRESFFGLENTSKALYDVGQFFSDKAMILHRAQSLVKDEMNVVSPMLQEYKRLLEGKNAAIYLKDAFTVFSLIEAFQVFGMNVTAVGVKGGDRSSYEKLRHLCSEAAVLKSVLDPFELPANLLDRQVDVFAGEMRERKIMRKLGVGCCNDMYKNHIPFVGYRGMLELARDVYSTIVSPVWNLTPRKRKQSFETFLLPQPASKRYQTA